MKHRPTLIPLRAALMLFFFVFFSVTVRTVGAQAGKDLGLRLVGTAVMDEPDKSFAIIEVLSTRNQRAFREGDRWGEIVIKKVFPLSVVIVTGKGEVILSLESGSKEAGPSKSPETAHLDRKEIDSMLPDYEQLMQAVRVRPRFEGGEPAGFVIYRIEPGTIFAQMGLKDGDVITAVNGKPVTTTQQAKEFYDALKKGGMVALEVRRHESKMDLHFEIQ